MLLRAIGEYAESAVLGCVAAAGSAQSSLAISAGHVQTAISSQRLQTCRRADV